MTITIKPAGRGNFKTMRLIVEGDRAAPFTVVAGHRFQLFGMWVVVVRVEA